MVIRVGYNIGPKKQKDPNRPRKVRQCPQKVRLCPPSTPLKKRNKADISPMSVGPTSELCRSCIGDESEDQPCCLVAWEKIFGGMRFILYICTSKYKVTYMAKNSEIEEIIRLLGRMCFFDSYAETIEK